MQCVYYLVPWKELVRIRLPVQTLLHALWYTRSVDQVHMKIRGPLTLHILVLEQGNPTKNGQAQASAGVSL